MPLHRMRRITCHAQCTPSKSAFLPAAVAGHQLALDNVAGTRDNCCGVMACCPGRDGSRHEFIAGMMVSLSLSVQSQLRRRSVAIARLVGVAGSIYLPMLHAPVRHTV
jgi:hypothetical protein